METVWKMVLRTSDDRLVSSSVIGMHELTYKPGEPIKHPNIFVFSHPTERAGFMEDFKYLAIQLWSAETTAIHSAPGRVAGASFLDETFEEFWNSPQLYIMRHRTYPVPAYTWLCDDLRLLERVW